MPPENPVFMISQPCQYGDGRGCITAHTSLGGRWLLSLSRLGPGPAQLLIRWIPETFVGAQIAAGHSHVVPKVKKARINTATSLNDYFLAMTFYLVVLYFATLWHRFSGDQDLLPDIHDS